MLKFEMKKVFSKPKNRIAVLVMILVLIVLSVLTINRVEYVDEDGNHSVGFYAARQLQAVQNEWAGYLTDDVLQQVIAENDRINQSDEAQSDDIEELNKAFAQKQGIAGIVDVISQAFSPYREYDYYAADGVSEKEVTTLYDRRISTLKDWLGSGQETYTQKEKDFLLTRYENLDTPFYYEYTDGWSALLQNISTYLLILALIIGFLVSGIFSDEFQSGADSIFFSAKYGRSRGVLAKAGAGFLITTIFYLVFVFLYTMVVLLILGTDGAGCPIQLEMWRSVYDITFSEAYLFLTAGGYIGTLFASSLAMLVSAVSRSAATAIIVPFIALCALPFLSRVITLPGFCTLFPDQLLAIYVDLKESALVEIGGRVMTTAQVILPVYAVVCVILQPLLYGVYRRSEVK